MAVTLLWEDSERPLTHMVVRWAVRSQVRGAGESVAVAKPLGLGVEVVKSGSWISKVIL
jgi:hypothetical protein